MDDLISRAKAIETICEEGTRLERNGTVAMAEIKQWCVDILDNIPPAQPEWISVKDRLPEEGVSCLARGKRGGLYVARLRKEGKDHYWANTSTGNEVNVVAWMEIPT